MKDERREKRGSKRNHRPTNLRTIKKSSKTRRLYNTSFTDSRKSPQRILQEKRGEKMTSEYINTNTEANKVDAKIIEKLTELGLKPDKDYHYNVVFKNRKKPDFLIKSFLDKNKYSFIIENKLKYDDLLKAKKQGIEYAQFLFEKNLLTKDFIIIITDSKSFYISKYKIDEEIKYVEDVNYIDTFDDLSKNFFQINSSSFEKKSISKTNQRNLKEIFDKINDKLRTYGLSKDQRMHLTMAFLFLKLVKEDTSLFGQSEHNEDLLTNIKNLETNLTETNIKNVFNTISKIFENKFSFSINEYLGKNLLIELWKIIRELDLDSYDLDVKGEAFEYFINYGNIKSDLGEYFTPRHIVEFIIKLLNEELKDRWLTNNEGQMKYLDPTCGTGGFLISIFKKLRKEIGDNETLLKEIKTKSVFGVELSKRTAEIAKMNMIFAGDGHTNIINEDFLKFKETNKNQYNVSIGNMPFGKKINEPEFVNGFLDVVKPNGYSIFIVPSGVIGTTSKKAYIQIREKLLTQGQILKIVSLPQGVFAPYTFAQTYIIFWKKQPVKTNYEIEFFEIVNDGFTLTNSRDVIKGDSDIELYFKDKNKLLKNGQIFFTKLNKVINIKDINENILSLFQLDNEIKNNSEKIEAIQSQIKEILNLTQKKEKKERLNQIKKHNVALNKKKKEIEKYKSKLTYSLKFSLYNPFQNSNPLLQDNLKALDEIAEITRGPFGSSIKKSICVGKDEGSYKVYEQSNIINNDFESGRYYLTEVKFQELKRFEIKAGDILMTCAGTLGKVAVVPQHFDKGIFNSVLMRFRCNEDVIIPEYLKLILQSNKMQGILVKDCIGVGIKNMIPTDELKEIRVPVPSKPEQQKIIDNIKEENKKIQTHLDNIASIKKKQEDLLNSV